MREEVAAAETFTDFVRSTESRLRRALVAQYGPEVGREAAADALLYGWENWDRVRAMKNPVGYLFRVGQSKSRRFRVPVRLFPAPPDSHEPWVEPALTEALAELSARQRTVVVLMHCFGWSLGEVGELLEISPTTVQKHAERGMTKLRTMLEVASDV